MRLTTPGDDELFRKVARRAAELCPRLALAAPPPEICSDASNQPKPEPDQTDEPRQDECGGEPAIG